MPLNFDIGLLGENTLSVIADLYRAFNRVGVMPISIQGSRCALDLLVKVQTFVSAQRSIAFGLS